MFFFFGVFFFVQPIMLSFFYSFSILHISCFAMEIKIKDENFLEKTNLLPMKQYLREYADSHNEGTNQKQENGKNEEMRDAEDDNYIEENEEQQATEKTIDGDDTGVATFPNEYNTALSNEGGGGFVDSGITIDDMTRGFVFGIP